MAHFVSAFQKTGGYGTLFSEIKEGEYIAVWEITGVPKDYYWGSCDAIPNLIGAQVTGNPVAEVWYGAHPLSPSRVEKLDQTLDRVIADAPGEVLGRDVADQFGARLPYMIKLIAPSQPLSLQVHPPKQRAQQMYGLEEAARVPLSAPQRRYKDPNHKPEIVYALTQFEALAGFRAPRRVVGILSGLNLEITDWVCEKLRDRHEGIRTVVNGLLDPDSRPEPQVIEEFVAACTARLEAGTSPSERVDRVVQELGESYPGDPGVLVAALMNPVTLQPGEVLFVPSGGIHAYISGLGVEAMAASDNVLRAGLTKKYIDVRELLECLNYVAAPPVRLAPERISALTQVFYAPVDDFELSVVRLKGEKGELFGRRARIALCVEGEVSLLAGQTDTEKRLVPGKAVFIPAREERILASGSGVLLQVDMP